MQDKIILGFLMDGEKTGYQVRKEMQNSTEFIFNTSLGSIYPAFRKLKKEKMVSCRKIIDSGRHKKIYSITEKGKDFFKQWMDEPTGKTQVVLIKIFFFSFINARKREKIISYYIEKLNRELNQLKEINYYLKDKKCDHFAYHNLLYGIDHIKFLIQWFEKYYQNLTRKK